MIFVSAGHGPGADLGVCYEGFCEHPEACLWRDAIVAGCNLLGTPSEAVPAVSLRQKVEHVNSRVAEVGKSVAIEVHFNAGGTPGKTRGCETLYAPKSTNGAVLADFVQQAMVQFFPPDRTAKEGWYKMDHPHRVDFPGDVPGDEKPDYFLVKTACPAVIIEPDFIYERVRIQGMREAAAKAIASALVKAHSLFSKVV